MGIHSQCELVSLCARALAPNRNDHRKRIRNHHYNKALAAKKWTHSITVSVKNSPITVNKSDYYIVVEHCFFKYAIQVLRKESFFIPLIILNSIEKK